MEINLILQGLAIGFAIAAPVGPIGVLCIRQSLAFGWLRGFVAGLGAATADAMYGVVAGFGLAFVTSFLVEQQFWLQLVGGAFLCYLGVKTFTSIPSKNATSITNHNVSKLQIAPLFKGNFFHYLVPLCQRKLHYLAPLFQRKLHSLAPLFKGNFFRYLAPLFKGGWGDLIATYTSTFALTLTNPATILSFAAIFSGLGLASIERNYFSALLLVVGVFLGSALWWLLLSGSVTLVKAKLNAIDLKWVNRISGIIITAFGIVALLKSVNSEQLSVNFNLLLTTYF